MNSLELHWLPPVPDNFKAEIRALRDSPDWQAERVLNLATSRLNLSQLHSLAKVADRAAQAGQARLKLAVLSNASTDLLQPALSATALRHGLLLDVASAPFGMFTQEALDPHSATHQRHNDFVLLALDHRAFGLRALFGDEAAAVQAVDAALQSVRTLVNALRATDAGCTVLLQTMAPPFELMFGSLDTQLPGTLRWQIERFNHGLRAERLPGTLLLEAAALAGTVGLERWHDATQWAIGKFAFAHAVVPLYAEHVCRLLSAAKGKSKKCLVLDLDNTLWGGVIGDDGMSGIVLGQGNPAGEAFLAVQATALELRARGIVLAVSSKNDEAVARQVFREHPDMLLREEHIAVFQANWQDKATNLKAIAATLNIGIDALVFLDDNPAERQQIRLALPQVGVPELPEPPELFAATLLSAGYFEAVHFTDDDKQRAGQYQANAARAAVLGETTDLASYLASLEMQTQVSAFDALGRARITQLINKTNQFNLTTRRYSEADVEAFEADPSVFGLQIRLKDRFGDNGMVSVLICRQDGAQSWLIDTWLMSCRVLNRGLEQAVLNVLMACAAERGITQLVGQFRPTEKNSMVKDHYQGLGFHLVADHEGATDWVRQVAGFSPTPTAIKVLLDAAVSHV